MVKVTALSSYLGEKMIKRGYPVKLRLIRQAGLLHDILKICDFKNTGNDTSAWRRIRKEFRGSDHVTAGYILLKSLGEDKIAETIKKHRFSCIIHENINERPRTWEEKILYYADKRVTHDKIVPLGNRLEDLNQRYGHKNLTRKSVENIKAIYQLEKEICSAAGLKPLQITDLLIGSSIQLLKVKRYLS